MKEWTMEASTGNIRRITEAVGQELDRLNCPKPERKKIDVALDELLSNIAHYAYAPGTGDMTVRMWYDEGSGTVSLTLIDSGIAFDPLAKMDPDITLEASERPIGGLGILMVKRKMDGVEYRREENRNILTIHKRIRGNDFHICAGCGEADARTHRHG